MDAQNPSKLFLPGKSICCGSHRMHSIIYMQEPFEPKSGQANKFSSFKLPSVIQTTLSLITFYPPCHITSTFLNVRSAPSVPITYILTKKFQKEKRRQAEDKIIWDRHPPTPLWKQKCKIKLKKRPTPKTIFARSRQAI